MESYDITKQAHINCVICGPHCTGFETMSLLFVENMDGAITTSFLVGSQCQGYYRINQVFTNLVHVLHIIKNIASCYCKIY